MIPNVYSVLFPHSLLTHPVLTFQFKVASHRAILYWRAVLSYLFVFRKHFVLQFSLSEKKNEKSTKTKWLNLFYDPYLGTECFGTQSRFVIFSSWKTFLSFPTIKDDVLITYDPNQVTLPILFIFSCHSHVSLFLGVLNLCYY